MLYIGIAFITIGLYLIFEDIYDIKFYIKEKKLKKKAFRVDEFYEFKVSLGLFSFVIGIFSLLNYFS